MTMSYLPPTQELNALFIDEVREMGCVCPDVYDDGRGLYARAFFSAPVEVRPGDAVHGGVALRAFGEFVDVHPFVYRQVCTNGAIVADALESRRVQRVGMAAPTVAINAVVAEVRLAVRGCGHPSAFESAVDAMRRATRQPATALMAMLLMFGSDRRMTRVLLSHAAERLEAGEDRSAFGLMNAITSLARDSRDPERRWRLEELGGGMLALIPRRQTRGPAADLGAQEDALIDVCA
jgi:hypothetical protein